MVDNEFSMVSAMSESFWKQKRARMKADLAAQLLELDEFEAREKALQEVVGSGGGGGGGGSLEVAELKAALAAEQAKSAALQDELQKQLVASEVNLQKVASFWIAKLDEAKSGALPAAADAPTIAPVTAAVAAGPVPDFVPNVPKPYLEEELSLKELRARLVTYGLSTTGLKVELRKRLEYALEHTRAQYMSWDVESQTWK